MEHLGVIHGGVEDKDSEQARQWAPAYENYRFLDAAGGTEVRVEQDTIDEYERYMLDIWPKALERLKALCEAKVGGAKCW